MNRFLPGDVAGLSLHVDWWKHELDRVAAALSTGGGAPVLAAGDFNMPPDDSTMVALRSAFRFAFEEGGWGYGYTRPTRCPWFRIDHILASPEWQVTRCWVGPDFGSDHLPLLADVVLPAGPAPPEMVRRVEARPLTDIGIGIPVALWAGLGKLCFCREPDHALTRGAEKRWPPR